jgi:hypothetical protein
MPSFGTGGDCYHNSMMESFRLSMQIEPLNRKKRRSRLDLTTPYSTTPRFSTTAPAATHSSPTRTDGTADDLVGSHGLWFSGRVSGRFDCLKLDRGEPAKSSLPAPAVVGPFDPGHDREPQFFAAASALFVEHVLLK